MLDIDRSLVGRAIKQQRHLRALSLRELAKTTGLSASHLGRVERGERFASAKVLRRLSKPLGFQENELFMLAGYLSQAGRIETASSDTLGPLDPYVAAVLSQETLEIQRAVIGILAILKALAADATEEDMHTRR